MEEKTKAPFWKPAFIYGGILGLISIFLGLVFYFLGLSTESWVGYISMAIGIAALVYSLLHYRKEYLGGFAKFGQMFLMAFMIGIISAIILAAYTYVLYTAVDPGLIDQIKIAAEEKIMSNPRIPESMYDGIFEKMEKRMTAQRMTIMALVGGIVINTILGLIISAFVKKEESPVNNAV